MRIDVKITDQEIREAIVEWAIKRGLPDHIGETLAFEVSFCKVAPGQFQDHTNVHQVTATVDFEADHFRDGPYR